MSRDKKSKLIKLMELGAEETETRQLMRRRWLQIILHSCIYYKLDDNIVTDKQYDDWSQELLKLKRKYPRIAQSMPYHEYLQKFDGSTGYDLPINNPKILRKAKGLLNYFRKENKYDNKPLPKTHRRTKKRKKSRIIRIHQS